MKKLYTAMLSISLLSLLFIGCTTPTAHFRHDLEDMLMPWKHERFDDNEDKFTFAIFSDLTGGERERIFEVAVDQINLLRPEMVMNVGDLIEGGSDDSAELHHQWDWFDKRAERARAPIFYMGGNHDLTGQLLRNVWKERLGPCYYHFVYKDVLFLVLNTEDNTLERMTEIERARLEAVEIYKTQGPEGFKETEYYLMPERTAGTIGNAQSDYFTKVISETPDVRWTFVFIHKPAWQKENEHNFAAIETALSGRPYTVFYGHTHVYEYTQRHGRDYINLATTGGEQFPEKGRSMDHLMLITVDETEVTIANLLMCGILDKTGHIPNDGDHLQYEKPLEE